MYICEFTSASDKVFSTLHLYINVLLFPVRFLPSGMKNSPTGTDRNNIFIKLKFQKTVILFSPPVVKSDNVIYNNIYANLSDNM